MLPRTEPAVPAGPSRPLLGQNCIRPLPTVALRAFHLLADDNAEIRELADTVSPDPAFVANLLQCANSALTGLTYKVNTVRHAATVLGRDRLRGLILTAALRSLKGRSGWSAHFQNWWRHSIASALLADGLAAATCTHAPGAYSAGLLHDIGRFELLARMHPAEANEFAAVVSSELAPTCEIERLMFGEDHCTAGADLLAGWQFPAELVEAAARHHGSGSPWLVAAGCRLATAMGFSAFPDRAAEHPDQVLICYAPVAEAGLAEMPQSVMDALGDRIESFESLPLA